MDDFYCALTSDRLFSHAHPHELHEDGLVYRVRGSTDAGLGALALELGSLPSDGELPLRMIDVVDWAGLRQLRLDKPGFVKRWQRYVGALQHHIEALPEASGGGAEASERLLLRSHEFVRTLMNSFDEVEILVGASENANGPLAVVRYLDEEPCTPYIYFLAAGVQTGSADRRSVAS